MKTWVGSRVKRIFFCCKKDRGDKTMALFEKGRKKINGDLDLRTYIKSVRHVQILQNVLLSEKQRSLLYFQKGKVIEFGSTSESDD